MGVSGTHAKGPPAGVPAELVARQVSRILESRGFASARKLGRFLSFTVEKTVQGQAGDIKEYLLGVEVFGRPASFDPRLDPIVRVQAAKLRTRLEEYYSNQGQTDPVGIVYHKGSYVPVISLREVQPSRRPGRLLRRAILAATAILVLGTVAAAVYWSRRPEPGGAVSPKVPSVAVLPFANFSGEQQEDYFSDGLTEEMISLLSRVEGLRVVARTSVFQFKGKHEDVRRIGSRLGADAVLEGSVRRQNERLRVSAQLIDVASGYNLWSATYERNSQDIFAIQDEIGGAIAAALKLQLSTRGKPSPERRRTASLEAHTLCLEGRYFLRMRTRHGLDKAREYFERALEIDPRYAMAYAGLADVHSLLATYEIEPMKQSGSRAIEAARKAIELDENLGEAHTALGYALAAFTSDWKSAEASFRRAIALNPGDATPHRWYAVLCLALFWRLDEALGEAQLAASLDPASVFVHNDLGSIYTYRGEFADAASEFRKAIELEPNYAYAHAGLGYAHERLGQHDEAGREFLRAVEVSGGQPAFQAELARFYAGTGATAQALDELRRVRHSADPYYLAAVYAALDQKDAALRQLESGIASRRAPTVNLQRYSALRASPRYGELMKRLGLPP